MDTSHSLLDRLSTGNSAQDWNAFESIYRPFIRDRLLRSNIPASDADDICQETLTQIFKAISGFQHNGREGAFRNWLKKIVRQKIWQHVNGSARIGTNGRVSNLHDEQAVDQSFEDQWEREHDRHVIEKLLQLVKKEFTDTSWKSFRRMVIDGEEPAQIASSLSVSVNAVLISKSRIMKRLREYGKGLVEQF